MADADFIRDFPGHREIVSLVGTLSGGEAGHLHTSLSDVTGHVIGSMTIFTTAEVLISHAPGIEFVRRFDAETGFDELRNFLRASTDRHSISHRRKLLQGTSIHWHEDSVLQPSSTMSHAAGLKNIVSQSGG